MRNLLLTILLLTSLACTTGSGDSGSSGKIRPVGTSTAAAPDTAASEPQKAATPTATAKKAQRAWDTAAAESFDVEELNRKRAEPKPEKPFIPLTKSDTLKMLAEIKPDEHGAYSYLKPSEYPGLPMEIASWLEERNYVIPQVVPPVFQYIGKDWTPCNAIMGEFIRPGQSDWAVYCTDRDTTVITLFHNSRIDSVEKIHSEPTTGKYAIGCPYIVTVAIAKLIYGQYELMKEHGAPTPPPVDHQGIHIGLLESASWILYYHNGEG